MELEITPTVDAAVARALADVLEDAKRAATHPAPGAWQRAALADAADRDERYAFSPRSTRGATRA